MRYLRYYLKLPGLVALLAFTIAFPAAGVAAEDTDFLEPAPIVRDVSVTGVVFEDTNGNGKREQDEKGLKDVWVTDEEQIKRSGANGEYEFRFKVEEHRCVYITLPNGYKAASPWYQLIRQDDPKTNYEFQFALQPDPAALDKDFAFLAAADSQFSSEEEGRLLKAEMAQITKITGRPRFYFIAGDLTMTGWLREWKWYMDAISALTIPCYNVVGGHECNYGREVAALKRASVHHFNLFCGPCWYSWNYGGRHFVVYNIYGGLSPAAKARQKAWLKADLEGLPPGAEVIVTAHYPMALDEWRDKLKITAFFYGHHHVTGLHHHRGTPYLTINPIRGLDHGMFTRAVRFCQFKDGRLLTEVRPTGQYKRLEVVFPQPDGAVPKAALPLRVLAYDTAARVTEATVELTGQDTPKKTFPLKQLGYWTWGADLDAAALPSGDCALDVTVKDDRGESWSKRCEFKAGASSKAIPAPGEDWPSILKSQADTRSRAGELKPPLELAWTANTGGRNQFGTAPIVHRGKVYIGTQNSDTGGPRPSLRCYDAATGRLLWKAELAGSVRFTPAAAEGRIYLHDEERLVYCFDAENGKLLWKQPHKTYDAAGHYTCQGPVMVWDDKVVSYCGDGAVAILDRNTGKIASHWESGAVAHKDYRAPLPGGDLLYSASDSEVTAYNVKTQTNLWKTSIKKQIGRSVALPLLKDGVLYVNGKSGLIAMDAKSGAIKWRCGGAAACDTAPVPAISDGMIYLNGLPIYAYTVADGKPAWSFQVSQRKETQASNQRQRLAGSSSPLVAGNVLYVGCEDEYLRALDKKTGKELWKFLIGLPVKSSPVVSGNMLFVSDYDGNLWAFAEAGESKKK